MKVKFGCEEWIKIEKKERKKKKREKKKSTQHKEI
jgi:hypothetical protein